MRVESMKLPGVLGAVLTRLSPKGGLHMRRFIAAPFSLAALLATLELRADSACPAGRHHPDLHQSPGNSLRADPGPEFLTASTASPSVNSGLPSCGKEVS